MRGVALMAQEGDSDLEKVFCCRAVRIMALSIDFGLTHGGEVLAIRVADSKKTERV